MVFPPRLTAVAAVVAWTMGVAHAERRADDVVLHGLGTHISKTEAIERAGFGPREGRSPNQEVDDVVSQVRVPCDIVAPGPGEYALLLEVKNDAGDVIGETLYTHLVVDPDATSSD